MARRVVPTDVVDAARAVASALRPHVRADWSVAAGDLEWDVEHTIVHLIGAPVKYAMYLSAQSRRFIALQFERFRDSTHDELVASIVPAAQALAQVSENSPDHALGFHSLGMTDAEGFVSKGCVEVLIHGWDASRGLGAAFSGDDRIAEAVLSRLFPWLAIDEPPWETLLWATGRIALSDKPRVDGGVPALHTPINQWDGTIPTPRRSDVVEWQRDDATGVWSPVYAT